jgi:hypothetical protein
MPFISCQNGNTKKPGTKLGMVVHTYNPSELEVEIEGLWFKTTVSKSYQDPISKTSLAWWHISIIPVRQETEVGGLWSEASWGKKI